MLAKLRKSLKFIFVLLLFTSACASISAKKAAHETKEKNHGASVCQSEMYTKSSYYKQVSEIEYINEIKSGERVYLQTETRPCEAYFSEGGELACGLHRTIKLVWEVNQKPIDKFYFLNSDCQEPNSPSLRMEPWDQNDVTVKNDIVRVRHYWNYYSRNDEDDERCLFHDFKLNRREMKLLDLGEKVNKICPD